MSQLSHKIYVDISLLSIPRAGRRRPDINMAMLRLSICQFVTPLETLRLRATTTPYRDASWDWIEHGEASKATLSLTFVSYICILLC